MGEGEGKALATQTTSLKSTEHEAIRRSDIDALIKALKDNDGDGKALATQTTSLKGTDHETIRRSDIDALIKALKDNGNSFGNTLGHSLAAYRRVKTVTRDTKLKKQLTMIMGGGESETNAQEEEVSGTHDQGQEEEIHVPEEEVCVPESKGQEKSGREEQEVLEEERVEASEPVQVQEEHRSETCFIRLRSTAQTRKGYPTFQQRSDSFPFRHYTWKAQPLKERNLATKVGVASRMAGIDNTGLASPISTSEFFFQFGKKTFLLERMKREKFQGIRCVKNGK
ncbi:hypothetical protein F2Q70_00043228 [Brassica cretica]|uniref:Uncharacterized protein n=1 Tax=Brassica cretica TaxID=69181 RepID=A0A8S9KI27_BRACR|nr:hypothetical protein F2Q70_00043228 [Brassica cretica]